MVLPEPVPPLERDGKIFQSDRRFISRDKLEDVVQQIAAGSNRLVNEASPIVPNNYTVRPHAQSRPNQLPNRHLSGSPASICNPETDCIWN